MSTVILFKPIEDYTFQLQQMVLGIRQLPYGTKPT